MAEEYIYERERDLLDYFRNNLEDPDTPKRGTTFTDIFTATDLQTEFVLTNLFVKNVGDTILVGTTPKRKGYDYYVEYGEGKKATKVILFTGVEEDEIVTIEYHHGTSMVEREYSRSDAQLPRVVMMFLNGSEQYAALGDYTEEGLGSYFDGQYVFEIRSKYASQARTLASHAFNLARKLRHANLYRVIIARVSDLQNFDYDREKDAYVWQFTLDIEWDLMFE